MKIEYLKGGNVVSLQPHRSKTLFPAICRVEAYWEGLRDGRLMPARAEVDPRGLSDVLEFAFMLERVAPGVARLRLAGMHLNELMAMEVRGMPFTALFLPEARRELQSVIEQVFDTPATARLALSCPGGIGRGALDAQLYFAPMTDAEGRATRIIGALQAQGRIGRGPRRFELRALETTPLTVDARPRAPRAPVPEAEVAAPPAFAEAATPFTRPARPAQPARLRLVHDADADAEG